MNPARYTYEPEFVTNYELGHKSDFLIGDVLPVRINSAVYYTDYTGLQKASIDAYVDPDSPSPVPQLGQSIFNVGSAWVAGFETDITVQPLPGLTLLGTYGYTRAEYEEFSLFYSGASPQLDCTGEEVEGGNVIELSCIPFQSTPEHQFSLSGRYLLPINPEDGDVEISLTYAWTDEQYSGTGRCAFAGLSRRGAFGPPGTRRAAVWRARPSLTLALAIVHIRCARSVYSHV